MIIILLILLFLGAGEIKAYRVGVDYHATGANLDETAFLTQYHIPAVRAEVKKQLQAMADGGIEVINTRLWIMDPAESRFPDFHPRMGFPISSQEITDLTQYVNDIKDIKTPSGKYLDLYITFLGSGCSVDFDHQFPACPVYSWNQYVNLWGQTHSLVIDAVGGITHPDGTKVVPRMYLGGEWMATLYPKSDQLIKDTYPSFVAKAASKGIIPSIYFIITPNEPEILDNNYVDASYPILNNHKSLFWVYRTTEFMRRNNLPIPDRIDFSLYPAVVNSSYEALVKRVFDDLAAVYPNKLFGVAETFYPTTGEKRRALGVAFANEANRRHLLQEILFWTTPNSGESGQDNSFPFEINDYYLPNTNPNCVYLNYLKNDGSEGTTSSKYHFDTQLACDESGRICSQNLQTYAGIIDGRCYVKSELLGDVNSDGNVDLIDFSLWKQEYLGRVTTKKADFDNSGTVDLLDFAIWKREYIK